MNSKPSPSPPPAPAPGGGNGGGGLERKKEWLLGEEYLYDAEVGFVGGADGKGGQVTGATVAEGVGAAKILVAGILSLGLFVPCSFIHSLSTSLKVHAFGQLVLNATVPDNPLGYWDAKAYGSGMLLLGLSGVYAFLRHICVMILCFVKATPRRTTIAKYLHKTGKLAMSGLIVSIVLVNAAHGLHLEADAGQVTNDVALIQDWGLLFLVAGTVAMTFFSHVVYKRMHAIVYGSSSSLLLVASGTTPSPKRDMAQAVLDSAGGFRTLVIVVFSAAVYVGSWLCSPVYKFSYGGVFGPSASPRTYSTFSMITQLSWAHALPLTIFVWILPALLITQCSLRCIFPHYSGKSRAFARFLLPTTTTLLASFSFTEFMLAAQVIVAPEVSTIVNQTLHDKTLSKTERGLEKLLCGTDSCLSVQDTLHAFAIIAFMFYALLPWVLPSITDLFFRGDDAEAYLTTGDDIVEADSLLKTPA